MSSENRTITSEDAVAILKEHSTIITIEQAELLLAFLYKFGSLTLHNIFKDKAEL